MIKTRSSLKALHAHRTGEYCAFSARRWAGSEVITHLFTSLQVARDKLARQEFIFRLFSGKSTKINFLWVCVWYILKHLSTSESRKMVDIFLHFLKLFTVKLCPLIISFNFSVKRNDQLSKKYKDKLKRDTQVDKTVFTLAQSLTGCQNHFHDFNI